MNFSASKDAALSLEERQQEIADLARHVLPFVEAQDQKDKRTRAAHHFLLLVFTAVAAFISAQSLRPISYSEERALSILLEHRAQKNHTERKIETALFLEQEGLEQISDMRAYQWSDALHHLTRDPP